MEKPKVRFDKRTENPLKHTDAINKNKPKVVVKSIVPVNLPIEISKDRKCVLMKDYKNSVDSMNLKNGKETFGANEKDTESDNLSIHERISAVPAIYISSESPKNQRDGYSFSAYPQEVNLCEDNSDVNKNSMCEADDEDHEVEVLEVVSSQMNSTRKREELLKRQKSNVRFMKTKFMTNNDIINPTNCASMKKENKENNSNSLNACYDKPNRQSKETTNKTQPKLQVMPCARIRMSLNSNRKKEKLPKIRKSAIFNVEEKKGCVISVQPSSSYMNSYNNSENKKKLTKDSSLQSTNLLSQPEYNSTLGVIKKLKEVEQEKLVTDIEHLPESDRNLIHGKVSAALDFAPYETVYKDLINLSVNDDQLPTRLARSKDPEPRSRDIIPKLSNFFSPKCAEQYFTTINPVIPHPIGVETLNAFKISNKIITWKNCRDN